MRLLGAHGSGGFRSIRASLVASEAIFPANVLENAAQLLNGDFNFKSKP